MNPSTTTHLDNGHPTKILRSYHVCTIYSNTSFLSNLTPCASGGGIGGFAFAIALGKTGAPVDIDIYDSEQDLNQIGAGIGFWPRAWEIMKILGLEESLSNANTNAYAGEPGNETL